MYTWQGPGKTYTKWVMIPLWVAHCVFEIIVVGGLGYLMLELAGRPEWGDVPPALSAIMAFLVISILLEPVEMVFQNYRVLEPWLYLVSQVYKTTFGSILLGAGIYVVVAGTAFGPTFGWVTVTVFVVLVGLMAASFYASLVYAAIVMHRHRNGYYFVEKKVREDDDSFFG